MVAALVDAHKSGQAQPARAMPDLYGSDSHAAFVRWMRIAIMSLVGRRSEATPRGDFIRENKTKAQ